jgi:hypothetical protein
MKISNSNDVIIQAEDYTFVYSPQNELYVNLAFSNGVGADLFVASGCDRDEWIDELIEISLPVVEEGKSGVIVTFTAKTTAWDKVEYIFTLTENRVVYHYKVFGSGKLETVRFFEGFLRNDPRMLEKFYPYFCGPGRHLSSHRPLKEFIRSSKPKFSNVYSYGINSMDKRVIGFYEEMNIRVNGDRHYMGGDWLATPAPFLYLMGNEDAEHWVTLGLAVKPGENRFMGYRYLGGEGFGLDIDYMGQTAIENIWESPAIMMEPCGQDKYVALESYVAYLTEKHYVKRVDRSGLPEWWKMPIFGGWGEQVFLSNRWDNFFSGQHDDWENDNCHLFCTQSVYEDMLAKLEAKGIDPTILIIDNRWFNDKAHLDVDPKLWPDLKGFIAAQHEKGRKVILWVSPWSYNRSAKGKDVPVSEHMFVDESELFNLSIDTDVFYEACKREHKKVRNSEELPKETLTDANWKFVADPQNLAYRTRVKDKIKHLLSPEGLNADGFEFDYTHFVPKFRATKPIIEREERLDWGVEALYTMIKLYYDAAKAIKPDALMISHTFNPYFNDITDMLRLQDIYTDNRSIVKQMDHRAQIAKRVCPGCVIHTDQHPMPSLDAWREYAKYQPVIGNPCTYYVTGIETTHELLTDEDFATLKSIWDEYRVRLESERRV